MAGILSRLTSSRTGHRRAQSAIDVREISPQNVEVAEPTPSSVAHGIETAVEFKPVECPIEPLDHDQPVKCPLPECSILNVSVKGVQMQIRRAQALVDCKFWFVQDARVWKKRSSSASARMRSDLPVVQEISQLNPEAHETKPRVVTRKRSILPSLSAPEHDLITLLEECNVAGDQTVGF